MSDSRVAAGPDRLPWLADEPSRRAPRPAKRRSWDMAGWAVAAMLVVAGGSFWLGTRSETPPAPVSIPPETTIVLPQPQGEQQPDIRMAPQPEIAPAPQPQVHQTRAPEVRIATPAKPPAPSATREAAAIPTDEKASPADTSAVPAPKVAHAAQLKPWPPRVTAGAAGRLVQVGAYGSRIQAKRGWWSMVRAYPAMERLPAVVVTTRNSRGRLFYRFQVGTTSQAHSEVLCQRIEKIQLSCAVVGLPWKSKVER